MVKRTGARSALVLTVLVVSVTSLAQTASSGDDWPTYMKDNDRSGATAQELTLPLTLKWTHRPSHPPAPAWPPPAPQNYSGGYLRSLKDKLLPIKPLKALVTYDRAFHVVSAGGKAYFGSSSEDKVVCLDMKTGLALWEFFTEGPVRLAPTIHGDRALFGSDDGHLYCVSAGDGKLIWRTRIGPKDKRLPGNERMISLWPVRTDALVVGDAVYCCAGLFPSQGVFHASVKLSDGTLIAKSNVSFSPQGYIRREGEKLVVDGGRDRAKAFVGKLSRRGETTATKAPSGPSEFRHAFIAAPNVRIGGGDGEVAAFNVDDGKKVWSAKVEGKACSLAIARGELLVSTSRGVVYCFAPSTSATPPKNTPANASPSDRDAREPYDKTAAAIVQAAGITKGYCLLLGASHDAALAQALATRTDLQIIVREPDAKTAQAARRSLSAAGLYGKRIVVHQGGYTQLPYVPNVFNLIVGDHLATDRTSPGDPAELKRLVRPQGGVVLCGRSPRDVWTRPRLEGAADWTHLYANAANTVNSSDKIVRPEKTLALQWFGKPGPAMMIDRHLRGSAHLACAGRLFVAAKDRIIVVDAYNGTELWQRELPGCSRIGIPKDSGNMAVDAKNLYVVIKDACHVIAAESGKTRAVMKIPVASHDWGYLAMTEGQVFGSAVKPKATFDGVMDPRDLQNASKYTYTPNGAAVCSDSVFSLDKATRRTLWTYEAAGGVIVNQTITIGPEGVYFVESKDKATREIASGHVGMSTLFKDGARLVCLDAKTGTLRWSRDIDLTALQHNAYGLYAGGRFIVVGSYTKTTKKQKDGVFYDVQCFDGKTGEPAWSQTLDMEQRIGVLHGVQNRHPVVLRDTLILEPYVMALGDGKKSIMWKSRHRKGCGQVSASEGGLFFRDGTVSMFGLGDKRITPITRVTRPGCWINALPACGVLLVPESSSGCVCKYAIQTSMAFMHAQP